MKHRNSLDELSQNSSFANDFAANNFSQQDSSGDDVREMIEGHQLEESKSAVAESLTPDAKIIGGASGLPDMWNQSEAKRGDGYFLFGA